MSIYIVPENQKLLWNIINKNELITQYFANYAPQVKENWFKQILELFYDSNKHIRITTTQLYELNKNTLSYMINDIKSRVQQKPSPPVNQDQYLKSYSVAENKEDKFTSQYNQYQQNYQSLFEKKPPEQPQFSENISEPAISNMDDLIQKHIRERDEELKKYAPPPLFMNTIDSTQNATNKIEIDNTQSSIEIQAEDINTIKTKKSVKWLDDSNKDTISSQQKEIEYLRTQVLELTKKFDLYIENSKHTVVHEAFPINNLRISKNCVIKSLNKTFE
jgi:hypothetical protein